MGRRGRQVDDGLGAFVGRSGVCYAGRADMVNAGDVPDHGIDRLHPVDDEEAPPTDRAPMVIDDEAFDPEASLDVRLGGVHGEDDLAAPDGEDRPDNVYEFRRPARALWGIFTR